jgi:hypothetical protein
MPNWKKVITSGSSAALTSVIATAGFTGSLLGTASYATQALSASNATTASYALTAQTLLGSVSTASYVVNTATGANSVDLVYGNMADNDQFRIRVGGTATNAGFAEIATADDGTEPIHVRQYSGVFSSLVRTATLLDGSGNSSFPGRVTAAAGLTVTGSAIVSGSLTVTGSVRATAGFTGSLLGTASFALTSSFTPNAIVTASVSSNTITFTKGNGTTFPITVNTGSGGATSPGGSTTEIQYNNAGAFAGTSTLTFDGTTITANPISATGYFIPQNALGSLSTVGFDYTISNPGIYRFTGMDPGAGAYYIIFSDPSSKADGQTIIIINADTTNVGYYDQTYNIQDPGGGAITTIAAGSADTFVNMEGIWIRTARRP